MADKTVFYHHPCIDGALAAWSCYQSHGDKAKYVGLDHADYATIERNIIDNVTPDTVACFVDFAPRKDILENILDKVSKVEVFDHHITAQKDIEGFQSHPKCEIVFDMERSGAGIAYDEFIGGTRPLFVTYVENLDLYKPERFESEDQFFTIASFISTIDVDRPFDEVRKDIDGYMRLDTIEAFENLGRAPRQIYLDSITEVLKDVDLIDLSFLKSCPNAKFVAASHVNLHDMGHEFIPMLVARSKDERKVGLTWGQHDEKTMKLSLRCDGSIDLSLVAQEMAADYGLNGGGHKGAASVRFTTEQFESFFKKVKGR